MIYTTMINTTIHNIFVSNNLRDILGKLPHINSLFNYDGFYSGLEGGLNSNPFESYLNLLITMNYDSLLFAWVIVIIACSPIVFILGLGFFMDISSITNPQIITKKYSESEKTPEQSSVDLTYSTPGFIYDKFQRLNGVNLQNLLNQRGVVTTKDINGRTYEGVLVSLFHQRPTANRAMPIQVCYDLFKTLKQNHIVTSNGVVIPLPLNPTQSYMTRIVIT